MVNMLCAAADSVRPQGFLSSQLKAKKKSTLVHVDCFYFQYFMETRLFVQLLWVILLASAFALIIQSLAANLGVVTGNDFRTLDL
jgi:hypothetical protein